MPTDSISSVSSTATYSTMKLDLPAYTPSAGAAQTFAGLGGDEPKKRGFFGSVLTAFGNFLKSEKGQNFFATILAKFL